MSEQNLLKKTIAFLLIGICVAASCIPAISGSATHAASNNYQRHIGSDTAIKVAYGKLRELGKTEFSLKETIELRNNRDTLVCFVFPLHPQGYIVIAASYDLPPVIAYSFTNSYQDDDEANILFELLIADLTLRLENIPLLPGAMIEMRHQAWELLLNKKPMISEEFEQWPPEGTTPTEGWLETNWHQEAPYNNFCPLDKANGGDRSVAGCPSVAMAMILNYHQSTQDVLFNDSDDYHHNYGGNNYIIDNDHETYEFPSFPELNNYLTTLATHYQQQIPLTDNDKAALTFACGVAARQVYGAAGSGTFGVNQAYEAYQKFNCTTIELLHDDDINVYGRLAKNMIDALPAHLAVVDEGWTMGHNVVVDGYNTDNYFHVNFGWGGTYNGWYFLPDEIPYGLTVLEGVIVDILDDHTGSRVTCNGTLSWIDVTLGETVTGSFTVMNGGTPGSSLNWEITTYPDWGTWTLSPMSGNGLTPENGPVTINVSVVAPQKRNRDFNGYVKVINTDNPDDCYIVQVSLATPYTHQSPLLHLFQMVLERFPYAFPLLRHVLLL